MADLLPTSVVDSPSPSSTTQLTNSDGKKRTFKEFKCFLPSSQKMIAEFLGTYIRVFIGVGSEFLDPGSNLSLIRIAMAWGMVVTAMAYTLRHVSGGHFNPAVTIGLAAVRRFTWKHVPSYVAVQLVASILASLTLLGLFGSHQAHVMLTLPIGLTSDFNAFVWEFIISFIMMFVACGVGSDPRAMKEFSGVAVGVAITFNVLVAGDITGASMNPARSLGPAIIIGNFHKIWIYLFAPVFGTATGAAMYNLLRLPDES